MDITQQMEPVQQQKTKSSALTPYQPSPYIILDKAVTKRIDSLYRIINNNLLTLDKPYIIEPDTHLVNNIMNAVLDTTTGELLEYKQLIQGPEKHIWIRSLANYIGRLAQGISIRMKTGTNTIFFIHPSKIPKERKSAYYKLVSSIRLLKTEINRVRVTIGGDCLDYDRFKSTISTTLTTIKIHLNSVVSTPNSKYMTMDIKDFFYRTLMEVYEYGFLPLDLIPDEIIQQYNLLKIASNGKVYFEIQKRMPGLKQAGIIAHN